jgi:hypothetical protein
MLSRRLFSPGWAPVALRNRLRNPWTRCGKAGDEQGRSRWMAGANPAREAVENRDMLLWIAGGVSV